MPLPKHIEFARELRKHQTPQEKILWDILRNRKLNGFKFLRQHPIIVERKLNRTSFYIADFYCAERKLVIEIDGAVHSLQIDYDKARNIIMNEMGIKVLRFTNDEIENTIETVVDKIIVPTHP